MSSRDPGTVFSYPYLWLEDHLKDIEHSKDRVTCLAIIKKETMEEGATLVHLFLLGISDTPRDGQTVIEIPVLEKQRAGLDPQRPAYVITSEYNYDVLPLSWHYDRNSKTFGTFSKTFTEQVQRAFLTNISDKLGTRVDRTGA